MGIAFDITTRAGGTFAGAKELGRGLMHGDRAELKLGYDARAAFGAVRAAFERDGLELRREEEVELAAYLIGFSCGMRDEKIVDRDLLGELGIMWWWPEELPAARTALLEGFYAGQDTDIRVVYPAGEPSPDQPAEDEIDGTRAGADMH